MSTQFSPVVEEIARQLHFTKPEHIQPGVDVGFSPIEGEPTTLLVQFPATMRAVTVRYEEGADHYTVIERTPAGNERHERVYCDTMTEIVWGEEAKDFEQALGPIVVVMFDEMDSIDVAPPIDDPAMPQNPRGSRIEPGSDAAADFLAALAAIERELGL